MAAISKNLNSVPNRLQNDTQFIGVYFLLCILLRLHSVFQCADAAKPSMSHVLSSRSKMADEDLIELVQKQTFQYFWSYGHPVSGLARERTDMGFGRGEVVTMGGSGFGVMSILVAAERQWISRQEAVERIDKISTFLLQNAEKFHGVFPHWMNGTSGKRIKFGQDDTGGDLVETSFLVQGLLCARQYFDKKGGTEKRIRDSVNKIWKAVEWTAHTRQGKEVLYWNDPNYAGVYHLEITGWNECLITYILAASSPTYPIAASFYHKGWARSGSMKNGHKYYDIVLPLGHPYGGPLFFTHYSFLGLDPNGLRDKYANYWEQNTNHTLIHYEYCVQNPKRFKGYGEASWGLTASAGPDGYKAHSPTNDDGTITPTAALSSFPYTPEKSMKALHHFYDAKKDLIWGPYGFTDAYNENRDWYTKAFLAIDQGPIVVMMENYRSGMLWKLFMSCPEVLDGLRKLDFESPYLTK